MPSDRGVNVSVSEIGALHGRYVRLSDRFKSLWTYHQFAAVVFKTFIDAPLPYNVDFQKTYDRIKAISGTLNASQTSESAAAIALSDLALDRAASSLVRADDRIPASVVRRFFERLKKQDDTIIHYLIKFYLYANAVEADRRDKLDFLFTRIGEDYVAERGEYWSRESLEFRERIIALVSVFHDTDAPQEEVVRLIRQVRSMREDIQHASRFEDLTEKGLLQNARQFKHQIGNLYFHPDILLSIVELNVSTKNKFLKLYQSDEQRMVADAQNLMAHGQAIERNFGGTNPELREELERFREFKERFDQSKADSNIKADTVTHLKQSIGNILNQLDRGLGGEEEQPAELPPAFFSRTQQLEDVKERFARDQLLLPHILKIAAAVDAHEDSIAPEMVAEAVGVRELRLEPWEVAAHQKLFDRRDADAEEDNEELWMLYLRAAALRLKVDEEATQLATATGAGVHPEPQLVSKAKQSLDCAKDLDETFSDFLNEAVYCSNARILHQLYRSRFRLLRGFSGLWLIYDRQN
ncbi:MAG: hypothetical protein ACXV5L_11355 [Thermoanaerobaculia bacterium]